MIIHNIKKDYGSHETLVLYRRPFEVAPPRCSIHLEVNCQICFKRGKLKGKQLNELSPDQLQRYYSNRSSSTRRSKTTITDYALCNPFSQFITLTFDQKLNNAFDYDHCKKLVSKWINNQRRYSPSLSYILVAEKHKSGAIHFHMITNNFKGDLTEAVNSKTGKKVVKNGKQIYNLDGWKYGFSTLSNIENKKATAYYLQKYLTKDFIEAFNKKRYWTSRGLIKPVKTYNHDALEEINSNLPIFTEIYKEPTHYIYTFYKGSTPTRTLEEIKRFTINQARAMLNTHNLTRSTLNGTRSTEVVHEQSSGRNSRATLVHRY